MDDAELGQVMLLNETAMEIYFLIFDHGTY